MAEERRRSAASVTLLQQLQSYEKLFRAADVTNTGSLSEAQFLSAFKGHMGLRAFLEIDSNCDGLVTWEEVSAQLLVDRTKSTAEDAAHGSSRKATPMFHDLQASTARQQLTTAATAGGSGTLTDTAKATSRNSSGGGGGSSTSRSREQQVALSALVHADVSTAPDRWYSADRRGVVQVWNGKDLSLLRSHQTSLAAITSATLLPSSGMLALGSYNPSLLLLDPSTGRRAGTLLSVASTAALSLCAWPAPATAPAVGATASGLGHTSGSGVGGDGSSTSRSTVEVCRDLLAVGDADGSVRLLQLDTDDTAGQKSSERFTTRRLWHSSNHRDWVVSVLHCPQISNVAAASLDKTISLTDLERCIAVRTLTGHTKPVHCCAWNSLLKVVASGSSDRRVLLWNPFSCRVLGALIGHTAPVVCLASNERDMQMYAASSDHTVKVWDLRNQRCLQTLQLSPAVTALGGHHAPLAVMAYSPRGRLMVSGAVRLQGWVLSDGDAHVRVGHKEAVSWAGCIQELEEVVSTDDAGSVCCWDLLTGRLRHSFSDTHGRCRISTACFDSNCRRLITGCEDGSIRAWNFRTGMLLSTLSAGPSHASGDSQSGTGSGVEVTGLAVAINGQASACIVATGWDRKVSWYADNRKPKGPLLRAVDGPGSDVLAAAAMKGQPLLATACDNGEAWLWNLDSGAVLRKLVPVRLLASCKKGRAVEALAFMHGDLRHILLAAGADCVLRFWDCHSGSCLEHHTSHFAPADDCLCAVAVSPDNSTAVTADTAGVVTVWDISSIHSALKALTPPAGMHRSRIGSAQTPNSRVSSAVLGASRATAAGLASSSRQSSPRVYSRGSVGAAAAPQVQEATGVRKLAAWQAHTDAVTALVWVTAAAVTSSAADAAPAEAAAAGLEGQCDSLQQPWPPQQQEDGNEQTATDQQQDKKPPLLHTLATAEAQQQCAQFLANLKKQQQQQQQPHSPQLQQQQPPLRQQQQPAGVQQPAQAVLSSSSSSSSSSKGISGFILSAGLDHSMVLWSCAGARVGVFGKDTWQLLDPCTWQDPGSSSSSSSGSMQQAPCQQGLQQQPSLASACSSSDCSYIDVTPRLAATPRTQASATAAAAAVTGEGACGNDSMSGPADSSSHPTLQQVTQQRPLRQQLKQHEQGHGSKPGTPAVHGESWKVPPPAAAQPKAVTFALAPAASPGAAAAVAAVAAEAKPPCGQGAAADAAASGRMYACGSSSSSSTTCQRASTRWAHESLRDVQESSPGQAVPLAAEEDVPSTLWLPQFTLLSRPAAAAAAAKRPDATRSSGSSLPSRPSTAAAALGRGLWEQCGMGPRAGVLATAGRSSVMLGKADGALGGSSRKGNTGMRQ